MPLTACTMSPAQEDIYACEDWANAYSQLNEFDSGGDSKLQIAIIRLTAEEMGSAALTAKNSRLSDGLNEVANYWESVALWLSENNKDLLEESDIEDKDIYRLCQEMGIETELYGSRLPDWYDPK
jgi:hypothetical protein